MDLYGLAPEEFTAARDAAAKTDKALKSLRKPTVSAWVINTLVRHDPKLLDDLTSLGASLLEAQVNGQGQELRALTEQRRDLIGSVVRHAIGLVDREVSSSAALEVQATLEAALADPASAEAVRSGQLVRPLSYSGFGAVDLEGAVAPLPRVAKPSKPSKSAKPSTSAAPGKPKQKDTSAAEARALEAAGALDDVVQRAARAARAAVDHEERVTKAAEAERAATDRVAEIRQLLATAEAAVRDAHRARIAAEKEQEALVRKASAASKAVIAAQEAADAARLALDKLRRG